MTILKMNFLASILILVIIMIRMSMLQSLPKKTFPVLWSIALYRLFVPFFVSSRFSVCTLINMLISRTISTDVCFGFGLPIGRNVVNNIESGIPSASVVKNTAGVDILFIQVLWLTGIFVCALFFLITHLRCLMEYKMSLPIDNVYIQKWKQEHAIRREVDIRQSDRITTPLTYGLFSPVVLLPKTMNWADETQLQYILAHEYAHIRRFDILFKWLLAIAVCVHWFNPLVWIMYILANRDMELSCDEAVVLTLGETIRYSYVLTLIELEEKKRSFYPLASRFSKNLLEERLVSIMKTRKTNVIGIAAAAAIAVSVFIVCTTDSVPEVSGTVCSVALETTSEEAASSDDMKETRVTNGPVDFIQSDETVNLINGTTSKHDVKNGQMVLYKNQNKTWSLKQGETIRVNVNIKDILKDGQTAVIGYVLDRSYQDIFSGKITQNKSIEFTAPRKGSYAFYFIGASSDTIHIQSVSVL